MKVFVSTWASDAAAAESRLAEALSLLREALGEAEASARRRGCATWLSWREN